MLNNGKKCTEKWLPFEFWYYGKSLGSSQLIRRELALALRIKFSELNYDKMAFSSLLILENTKKASRYVGLAINFVSQAYFYGSRNFEFW